MSESVVKALTPKSSSSIAAPSAFPIQIIMSRTVTSFKEAFNNGLHLYAFQTYTNMNYYQLARNVMVHTVIQASEKTKRLITRFFESIIRLLSVHRMEFTYYDLLSAVVIVKRALDGWKEAAKDTMERKRKYESEHPGETYVFTEDDALPFTEENALTVILTSLMIANKVNHDISHTLKEWASLYNISTGILINAELVILKHSKYSVIVTLEDLYETFESYLLI